MFKEYDVIVVGAGHAGCEAAAAAANMGSSTLLITMNMQTIAQMSCNPAMGGIAKGQIVREIDALGGYSGIVTDRTAVQFRMLNRSKGPAMWSPRAQSDRWKFAEEWRLMLEATPNLDFWQDMVKGLIVEDNVVKGVITGMDIEIRAKSVVLTNGTFLNVIIRVSIFIVVLTVTSFVILKLTKSTRSLFIPVAIHMAIDSAFEFDRGWQSVLLCIPVWTLLYMNWIKSKEPTVAM